MSMFKYEIEPLSDIFTVEAEVEAAEVALSEMPPKDRDDHFLKLRLARLDLQATKAKHESVSKALARTRMSK
jgi:hypothetical protein